MKNVKYLLLSLLILGIFGCDSKKEDEGQNKSAVSSLTVQAIGLAGNLIVSLNGQEELILKGNGSYSFKSQLPANSTYQVRIIQNPTNHLCELKNASGKITSGKTASVEVICRETGRWHHPAAPTDAVGSAGQSSDLPATAIDDQGNVIVVWSQFIGSSRQVLARESREGKWLQEKVISKTSDIVKKPKVALAANGDMVIVWEQSDKNNNYIMLAQRRGSIWTLPKSTADHISVGPKYAWEAEVALNDSGDTVIAWSQQAENGLHAIYMSEYRNSRWQHPKGLNDYISPAQGNDALRPRVAINNSGEALIVWEQDVEGTSRIFKSEFRENKWSHPADHNDFINPKIEGHRGAYNPFVAMDEHGNALLAWKQAHGSRDRIYLSEYRNSRWHHPQSLEDAASPTEIISGDINDLIMTANGDALLLWTSFKERKLSLYKSEYRLGQWIHPPEEEPFVSDPQQWQFRVYGNGAMAKNGKTVTAWLQQGDDNMTRAYFAEYDKGKWNFPGKLLNIGDHPVTGLAVSASSRGNFIIAWQQGDDENAQVFGSLYRVSE